MPGAQCTRSLASPTPIPTIGVHPAQADAAERTRKPDEGGLREADSGCQSVGNDTAVNAVHSVIARSDLSAVAQRAKAEARKQSSLSRARTHKATLTSAA